MWFKQIQIYQIDLPTPSSANVLSQQLESLAFRPCLPSMPESMGWVPPLEEDEALARGLNGCYMICLQIEEKILPAAVVGQNLKEKIKEIELSEARRVRQKEKVSFKEEIIHTLLPRAFTKLTKIYAYIDTRHRWLIINSVSATKVQDFLNMFKKSLGEGIESFDLIQPADILTHWLLSREYPQAFAVEKACLLQDPNQQKRTIRCQQQDLFATSIQSLLKDGCEVMQLALTWQDRLNFVLGDDFILRSIRLANDDLADIKDDIETPHQKFDADLIMMTEMFSGLLKDLLQVFSKAHLSKASLALAG